MQATTSFKPFNLTSFLAVTVDRAAIWAFVHASQRFTFGLDVDPAANIAYATQSETDSVMAIDLVSGDRVLIAH